MTNNYPGEQWKKVIINGEFTNEGHLEVSNFGRLRSFNKISNGNIVEGSMINGYRIIRLKLFSAHDEKTTEHFAFLRTQVFMLMRKIKSLKENNASIQTIEETTELLNSFKKNLSKKIADEKKKRTYNYHSLVHRLVADYFLKPPTEKQTIVSHLDFNKLNNRPYNLKWMTPEENYEHQKNSPYVIKEKKDRLTRRKEDFGNTKLTVTRVMMLKKLLKSGKPMKQLVKLFKVTHTQINRIKKGENWADIEAAE